MATAKWAFWFISALVFVIFGAVGGMFLTMFFNPALGLLAVIGIGGTGVVCMMKAEQYN